MIQNYRFFSALQQDFFDYLSIGKTQKKSAVNQPIKCYFICIFIQI